MAQFPDDFNDAARRAARDAHYAARAARRAAHRASFRASCARRHWFFPILLIGMGVLFLLGNLNLIETRVVFRNIWPLVIVLFGLSRLFFGIGGERVFGAIATVFGGLWLADRVFDLDVNIAGMFWPLILIGVGISMLFGRQRRWFPRPDVVPPIPPTPGGSPPPPLAGFAEGQPTPASPGTEVPPIDAGYIDQAAQLNESAFLASIERRNVSQVFRGGELTAVMGSVEVDLRDCRMADATATIVAQVVMGQVVLRLPATWTVESHLSAFMGNVEDHSDRPIDANPKRLILHGSAFMGQIEIRN